MHSFRSLTAFGALLIVVACQPAAQEDLVPKANKPMRIVSLDYCADQFVLKLADRSQIAAISPDADKDFSFMRSQAPSIAQVRQSSEDILALKPDLIIRSYGGGPQAMAFFEKAGIKVHQIGWGDDFSAVRTNVLDAANAMGQNARGQELVDDFDRRLALIKPSGKRSALYITAGGVTTGPGSMIDRMMNAAGLTNFQTKEGWTALPLERLTRERPDLMVTAFFGPRALTKEYWSPSRHWVAQNALLHTPTAPLDGATTACAGWFVADGIELLARYSSEATP